MANQRSTNKADARDLRQDDFAAERMGSNRLEGNDQLNVRNERHAVADERRDADSMEDSFRKLDKDARARLDLNKGATKREKG